MGESNVLPMISGTGLSFPTVLLICFLVCLLSFAAGFIVGRWYFRYRFTVTRYHAPTQENSTQSGPRPEWSMLSDALNNMPSDALIKSVFISSSIFQKASLVRRESGQPDTSTYRYHVFERCKHISATRGSIEQTQERPFIRFKLCGTCEKKIIKGYSPIQDNVVESEDEPREARDSASTHESPMMRLRRTPDSNGNTVNPYRDWEFTRRRNPAYPVYNTEGDLVGITRDDAAHAAYLHRMEQYADRSNQEVFQEMYVHELEHLAHEHIDTAASRARENLEQT